METDEVTQRWILEPATPDRHEVSGSMRWEKVRELKYDIRKNKENGLRLSYKHDE